jgi:outer membrane usher protein
MGWPPTAYRWPAWMALAVLATGRQAVAAPDMDAGAADGGPAPTATEATAEERPAFLHLKVNEVDVDDVFVVLRGGDVLVKISDLGKPGLHINGGVREKRAGDEMVWLRSLAPGVRFTSDERNLTLTVRADPSLFDGTTIDLRGKRPEGILYDASPGFFANYLVRGSELQDGQGGMHLSGLVEAGLSARGHLLYGSGQRNTLDGSYQRLLTNATFDFRDRLASVVLGDFTATGDVLGGGLILGGLSVARNYSLDPYFVFLPTQRLSGTALTPSIVEVYVNGQLVRREDLPPGQFSMQNVPVTTGSGSTRVVVRDAFGATQSITSPYYMALGTLARGLHDFSYNLGFVRKDFGFESWSYGRPALLAKHRYGVTNWLTVGARVEGHRHLASGGPSVTVRLPVGELGAVGAMSYQQETMRRATLCWYCTTPSFSTRGFLGTAGLLSYSYMGRPIYLQAGVRYQSRDYASLVLSPSGVLPANAIPAGVPSPTDRQRLDITTAVARNISRVASLSFQYQATEWWEQGWVHRLTLMGNRTINRWMYAYVTLGNTYQARQPAAVDTFVGLSFAPADRVTAGLSRADHWGGQSDHGGSTQAMVQQSLPVGPGLGYRVVATQGENDVNQANAQYQGAYGRIEADYQHKGYATDARGHLTLSATGGIVFVGGRAFLTRTNQDSYALVRVPGVKGVHATVSNQVVGVTDAKGDLLIPNLLHYYGNRIGIDDKDIPLDHDIGATERIIAPPFRGGMVVSFPVRRVQSVSGTALVREGGVSIVPSYGQIVVKLGGKDIISPLDEAGNFYLENVGAGRHPAQVQFATGACDFTLDVPEGATALVSVGTVTCAVGKKETQ